LLTLCPTPKLEYHTLSAVRVCLLNIFPATLHIGGRSSIHKLMTRHDLLTGNHLSRFRTLCLQTIWFFLYGEIRCSSLCLWNIFITWL